MPKEKKQAARAKGDKVEKTDSKVGTGKNEKKRKTRITGGGTVGYTVKPVRGHY